MMKWSKSGKKWRSTCPSRVLSYLMAEGIHSIISIITKIVSILSHGYIRLQFPYCLKKQNYVSLMGYVAPLTKCAKHTYLSTFICFT